MCRREGEREGRGGEGRGGREGGREGETALDLLYTYTSRYIVSYQKVDVELKVAGELEG